MSASAAPRPAGEGEHEMQCMEIWGGNRAAQNAISVHGIDAWVCSQPHAGDTAGGDIHYVSMCGHGHIARFAIADVAGHGTVVDALAGKLRSLMRKHINHVDQADFARSLNREFGGLAEGGIFATAVLMTYLAPSDHLVICNAGHPAPLWYRAETGAWQRLEHACPDCETALANLPLGIIDPTDYHQFAVPLGRGDLVVVYTDSLIEAETPDRKPLGIDGLARLLGELDEKRPQTLCQALIERVTAYQGGQALDDDTTILVMHHNAIDPPPVTRGPWASVIGKMMGLIKV